MRGYKEGVRNMERNRSMKPFGNYVYLAEFNAGVVSQAINYFSKHVEGIAKEHGPAHELEWVIKEYPPMTPIEFDEDGKAIRFSTHTAWSNGWKAWFEQDDHA